MYRARIGIHRHRISYSPGEGIPQFTNIPNPEVPTIEKEKMEKYAEKLAVFADRAIKSVLEEISHEHGDKQYHNLHHTETVVSHARDVLVILKKHAPEAISSITEIAADLGTSHHDRVLEADRNEETGMMQRRTGANEEASFVVLQEKLMQFFEDEKDTVDDPAAFKAYIEAVAAEAQNGVMATVPDFRMTTVTPETLTGLPADEAESARILDFLARQNKDGEARALDISQQNMTDTASLATLTVGMSDIMQVGRVSFEDFAREGNSELRELNYVLDERMQSPDLTPADAADTARRILGWYGVQPGFALMQGVHFEEYLANNAALNELPHKDEIKKELRELYNSFILNTLAAIERSETAQEKYGHLVNEEVFRNTDTHDQSMQELAELARQTGIPVANFA